MAKKIIIEFSIAILIIVIISIILGIMFYDYNPNSRIIPSQIQAYTTPDETQNELNYMIDKNEEKVIKTYTVDSHDLKIYKTIDGKYEEGKINPFIEESVIPNSNMYNDFNSNQVLSNSIIDNSVPSK